MQEQIFDALRRGANEEALAAARAAVEGDPDSALCQRMLAMALSANGDHDGALRAIDRALERAPEEAALHFQRAGMLLGVRQTEAARAALAQSVKLDPNQFGAYILQAQLALGRGDLDEAERLNRLAALVAPEHPWRAMVDGMVALGRGQAADALRELSAAAAKAPDDPQVLLGLALAYIENGHLGFAEQALRNLLDQHAGHALLRVQLAQVLQRQDRIDDALEALAPLLHGGEAASVALLSHAGELELAAGRPQQALQWLRRALATEPGNVRVLQAALSAWKSADDADDARATLESALATAPGVPALWRARLSVEADAADGDVAAIFARWNKALPGDVGALELQMRLQQQAGDMASALDIARRIVSQSPGNALAQAMIVEELKSRDPGAAVAHVARLLSQAENEGSKRLLATWLASLEDDAGLYAQAAERWATLAAAQAPGRLPLPPLSLPPDKVPAGALPAWEPGEAFALDTLFLWGPPGSCVEAVASQLSRLQGFRADRFRPDGVRDGFQTFSSVDGLSSGDIDPAAFIAAWRNALAARGIRDDRVIEWLVWWDNALLRVLRSQLDKAGVLIVLRDPRDMLLQWLAFGSPMQFGLPSVPNAAAWLGTLLTQVASLSERELYHCVLLRIDGIESDGAALAQALSEAIGTKVQPQEVQGMRHLPSGHWRNYADVLAEPFAMLTPVAVRLGYPET